MKDNFTPLFEALTREHGLVTSAVYGRIWRYCQHDSGLCFASHERIGGDLGIDRATVGRHTAKLIQAGYIEDTTPDRKNHPHTYRLTQKSFESVDSGVAESSSGVAENNTGVAQSRMKIEEDRNQETKSAANAGAIVTGIPQGATVANSTSLEKPIIDGVGDYVERGLAAKANATAVLIRGWNLSPHLEDTCLMFAEIFGIEADSAAPTINKKSKKTWADGATELYQLKPTYAELVRVRDYAAQKGYGISQPRAAVKTLINLRQLDKQTKPAALAHPAPTRAFEWRQNEAGEMYRHYTDSEVQA